MRTICGWQRNWRQFAWSTDNQFASSVQMHSKCGIKTIHGETPLWKNDWFLWTNYYTKQHHPTETKSPEISGKIQISSLLKCIAAIHVLSAKIYISVSRKIKQFSFQLPKTKTQNRDKIIITPELLNELHEIKDFLDKCCQKALTQPSPDK